VFDFTSGLYGETVRQNKTAPRKILGAAYISEQAVIIG